MAIRRGFWTLIPHYSRRVIRVIVWRVRDFPSELRLGIQTAGVIHTHRDVAREICSYGAIAYSTLRDIRRHLEVRGTSARRFVDMGCGLGRPLYFFADARFDELIGYEVTPELFRAAQALLARAKVVRRTYGKITLIQADGTTSLSLDRDLVLFLYNPFGAGPMRRLCDRIKQTHAKIQIYYANPIHSAVVEEVLRLKGERIDSFVPVEYYQYGPSE